MRGLRHLSRAHARDCSDRLSPAAGHFSFDFRTEADRRGKDLTDFLNETVVDLIRREHTARSGARVVIAASRADAEQGRVLSEEAAASGGRETTSFEAESAIPLWKRTLDFTVICLTSPLWLPVMILIMLAIKIGSPGPVFYRQERVGYRGRNFMIFKFRTMKVNVETQIHESHFERLMVTNLPMVKLDSKGDPRLIRFGRFLRAAGLDELPQIFNVWAGEMSLVGPRPCTIHEFEHYEPWQRERVNAPPGLTGFWQVNGKNRTTFSEMIDMDILYGNNMSLRLDLLILLKTIPAVIDQFIEQQGGWWSSWNKQQSFSKRTSMFENMRRL